MTLDQINQTIRNIIRTELGLPEHQVRPANRNAPTGDAPFATVLISDALSEGFDSVTIRDTINLNVIEKAEGLRKILVSIQFFRTDAVTLASRLRARFQLNSAVEKFAINGLGYIRCSGVRILSNIQDTFWEERAQVDLDVYVMAVEEETLATYGQFPIQVNTETGSLTTTVFEP